jgi:hypothetical protein
MKKKITVPYFPAGLKYATPLPFGAGIYLLLTNHAVWGVLLILVGILVLTTNYVTEINLQEKTYNDFLSLLGLKLNNESKKFHSIDRIVISKGNYSQTLNTRWRSRQLDWADYTGTLILDNDTLDLLTKQSKRELLKGLKEFSDFLNVSVEDRTSSESCWIDMSKY